MALPKIIFSFDKYANTSNPLSMKKNGISLVNHITLYIE